MRCLLTEKLRCWIWIVDGCCISRAFGVFNATNCESQNQDMPCRKPILSFQIGERECTLHSSWTPPGLCSVQVESTLNTTKCIFSGSSSWSPSRVHPESIWSLHRLCLDSLKECCWIWFYMGLLYICRVLFCNWKITSHCFQVYQFLFINIWV